MLALVGWLAFARWEGAATLVFFLLLYGVISDFLDGYLARKYGSISNFGKIMDAIVDKVLVLGSLSLAVYLGRLFPAWLLPQSLGIALVALIAVRELGITLMRLIAARKGVVLAAEKTGKWKAIWQMTAICVLFAQPMFARDFEAWLPESFSMRIWADYVWINGMLYFLYAAYLTILSGLLYVGRYWRVVMAPRPSAA